MSFIHNLLRGTVGMIACLACISAFAQNYPRRDITFIVPYGPGGSTDPISRQFTSQLEKELKGNVNVENRPGGSATIGMAAVIRAKPDGYTLGLTSNSVLAYQPLVNKSLAWKNTDDYESIVKLVDLPTIIAVKADSPWQTFDEFMNAVRKNPGKIRASVSGYRTAPDLAMQQLNKVAQVKIRTIPFSGGGGEALVALLGGRVEATAGYAPTLISHVQSGAVRVIASFTKGRYERFPDAASIVQSGYDVTLPAAYSVIAPKGIPADILETIVSASMRVAKSQEFAKFARDHGLLVDPKGPSGLRAETDNYGKLFADLIVFMDQK